MEGYELTISKVHKFRAKDIHPNDHHRSSKYYTVGDDKPDMSVSMFDTK
jgi:hypothetical protein